MSACEEISSYLEGQLEADRAEQFEAHLEGCSECRRAVEAWRTIAARIVDVSNADSTAVEPTTHEQLLLVQRAELERDVPRFRAVRLALAASVLLAMG
ncbi:MAG: zf-HC2 domain-containing protein, partial [Deltaproteobacteria bacterium]|nr:zf-HC2 domain-containing protein [Deltaproteobacteria bacterium]